MKITAKALPCTKILRLNKREERRRRMRLGLPVPKTSGSNPPYGYKVDEKNPEMYVFIPELFQYLIRAREYVKTCSYRETAGWLTAKGYPITYEALAKIMRERHPLDEALLPFEEKITLL